MSDVIDDVEAVEKHYFNLELGSGILGGEDKPGIATHREMSHCGMYALLECHSTNQIDGP